MGAADPGWLLRAWERGSTASPAARGAVLCEAAGVTPSLDAALDLSLDALATALARTYREAFASSASGLLTCEGCGQVLDVEVPLGVLADAEASPGETVLTTPSGRAVRVRVPTTRDLLHARDSHDVLTSLVERCVSDADPDALSAVPLEGDDLAAVDAALEALAGAAAVSVSATCPSCGAALSAPVDVTEFVWERVQQHAPALLADVADLARSFGWTEDVILALSPLRRRSDLTMVREAAR